MRLAAIAVSLASLAAAGCGGSGSAAAGSCPVTLPNGSVPSGASNWAGNEPEGSHGSGKLWTLFWAHNVVVAGARFIEDNGSVRMKWPWWRGVPGALRIEGRRLDADAPPLRAEVPPFYGETGFQPTAIFFPTAGCWEVTARVGEEQLTFVTLVLKTV